MKQIQIYSSTINENLFSKENKKLNQHQMYELIEKYKSTNEIKEIQFKEITYSSFGNEVIMNTKIKFEMKELHQDILILVPKIYTYYISTLTSMTVYDYFHYFLIRMKPKSLIFSFQFSTFTSFIKYFPKTFSFQLPPLTQMNETKINIQLMIQINGFIGKVNYSLENINEKCLFYDEKITNGMFSSAMKEIKDEYLLVDGMKISVEYLTSNSYSLYFDQGHKFILRLFGLRICAPCVKVAYSRVG